MNLKQGLREGFLERLTNLERFEQRLQDRSILEYSRNSKKFIAGTEGEREGRVR